jgi:hypothetical protein
MKNPLESIQHFCMIQLEILKQRELKLRKEIEDCHIQREFLISLLKDIGELNEAPDDLILQMLNTIKGNIP